MDNNNSDDLEKCQWCGELFEKKHHSEKYCSDECRENARSEQSRNKSHRWYHRHKYRLSEKERWGLGSGLLRQHRNDDFEKELRLIENEFRWLHLKRNR